MANGKFSQPRNRDQEPVNDRPRRPIPPEEQATQVLPTEEIFFSAAPEERSIESESISEPVEEEQVMDQAFLDVTGQEEPEDERELPPFVETLLDFVSKNRKMVLVGACALLLVVLIGIIAFVALSTASDPYGGLILNNVTIAGVNVGGMTRSEAENAVRQVTDGTFTEKDMVVELQDTTLRLSPADTGAELDVKAAVKAAYNYGRTGTPSEQQTAYEKSQTSNHTIGLLPYLNLDTDYIMGVLEDYASQYGSVFTESSYELVGDMPALDAEEFDETAPCQTLVLTVGTPGLTLDIKNIYDQVLDAYSLNRFSVKVDDVDPSATPEPLDLDAIYEEICIEPVEASVDLQTFESIPGIYGYSFDLEKAKKLVNNAEYGDIIEISMEYVAPEELESDGLFQDVLGSCETPHSNSANRTNNLRLACEALNGLILMPGEEFSYNGTLGERTTEKGYLPAPAYSGDELVNSVGGGVCQGSSTLYYCALLADLEIVERVNHGFPSSYIDYGMDATVSWWGPDFKFKNNTNYPIKIEAETTDTHMKMKILGTEERDYYVKMEYEITGIKNPDVEYVEYPSSSGYPDGKVLDGGATGYYVKTYKCKYSRETDELLSRDYETLSSYMTRNKVVVKIVDNEETPAETTPTETTPPATEPPATEPSATTPPATETPATEPPATQPPATEAPAADSSGEENG